MVKAKKGFNLFWTVLLSVASVLYVYPILMILLNSFKKETSISTSTAFLPPTADTFAGAANYVNAISSKGFLQSFWYSTLITVTSVALILLCCSMCAWYITRVNSLMSKAMYYLCVFSMVVPFQMVMFTLSQTADSLGLNKPSNIAIIYLGFGAGLAVFMFCGFVKSIPLEIEEAAMIDGCNPIQTYFRIVFPIFKPTMISVAILEAMWVWNDYLLPTLVLDIKKYRTIPMLIQYFRGSYGRVEMGPMMACIMLTVLPIIILYLACQKYIIEGVVAGDVAFARRYLDVEGGADFTRRFIRAALASDSDTAVIPMPDWLGLGAEARINTPSTLGGNWLWRMDPAALTDALAADILALTKLYGRC